MSSEYGPPFYYSYDDGHNKPYISGPYSEDELDTHIDEDCDFADLLHDGFAENDYGEEYRLWTAEMLEREANHKLEQARKIRAGEKLP